MTDTPLNFSTEESRRQWIIDNAVYFTVVRFVNRAYERHEFPSLEEAEKSADSLARINKANYLIYAVGPNDYSTYVKTIKGM